ncbi:MAG: DUF1116 domain-containing protein [Nitrososphaeria archaeon]
MGRIKDQINAANKLSIEKILESQPLLVDVKPAFEVIPGLKKNKFLHAGPPIQLDKICGPHIGSLIGAILFEGLAETPAQAKKMIDNFEVEIEPAHHFHAVAGAGHMISASQPLFVVFDKVHRSYAYTHMKEETFKALRYGVYDDNVIRKLNWLKDKVTPALRSALKEADGIDMRALISKSIMMGDDGHNRCQASTALFGKMIIPMLFRADVSRELISDIAHLLDYDDNWMLYPIMAACKLVLESGHNIKNSTVVTTMARNGVEFGIRVSGLGDRWFTAPARHVQGSYFPGYTSKDACPDLGDSCITETAGIGGFAMAASPALIQFGTATGIGGTVKDAILYTKEMYEITLTKNSSYPIPYLDFIGTPTGIDVIKVVETGIEPIINTSITHKKPGFGQIGAGLVRAPIDCFNKAIEELGKELGI